MGPLLISSNFNGDTGHDYNIHNNNSSTVGQGGPALPNDAHQQ